MSWKDISLDEFIHVYNKYPPNAWVRFAYKYFSKETEMKDMKLGSTVTWILIALFAAGFISNALNLPHNIIGFFSYSYAIILSSLVLYLFSAGWLNNLRLKKIRKELGVTKDEYYWLVKTLFN